MCCSVLQRAAFEVLLSQGFNDSYTLRYMNPSICCSACCSVLQCVAGCYMLLQCVAVCCSALQRAAFEVLLVRGSNDSYTL